MVLRPADDTIARKVNASDASAFAKICGCFPSQGKPNSALYLSEYVLIAGTLFHKFQKKCGVSSGSSLRSSFSSLASWSASSPLRYAAFTNRFSDIFYHYHYYFAILAWGSCSSYVFCRNRRLSRNKTRSTFCPLPGRTAQFRCRYRHRLYYYSAPCHLHYSLCYGD